MPEKILTRREVEELTSLKRSSLYKLMGLGRFPRAISLSLNRVGWRQSDVARWIDGPTTWSQS